MKPSKKLKKASSKAVEKFKASDEYSNKLCDYYVEGFNLFWKYMAKHHPSPYFSWHGGYWEGDIGRSSDRWRGWRGWWGCYYWWSHYWSVFLQHGLGYFFPFFLRQFSFWAHYFEHVLMPVLFCVPIVLCASMSFKVTCWWWLSHFFYLRMTILITIFCFICEW